MVDLTNLNIQIGVYTCLLTALVLSTQPERNMGGNVSQILEGITPRNNAASDKGKYTYQKELSGSFDMVYGFAPEDEFSGVLTDYLNPLYGNGVKQISIRLGKGFYTYEPGVELGEKQRLLVLILNNITMDGLCLFKGHYMNASIPTSWIYHIVVKYHLLELSTYDGFTADMGGYVLADLCSILVVSAIMMMVYENNIRFPSVEVSFGETECCLCLESLDKEETAQVECGHKYHRSCIVPWLYLKNRCPLCRHKTKSTLKDVFADCEQAVEYQVPSIPLAATTSYKKIFTRVFKALIPSAPESERLEIIVVVDIVRLTTNGLTDLNEVCRIGGIEHLSHYILERTLIYSYPEGAKIRRGDTHSVVNTELEAATAVAALIGHIFKEGMQPLSSSGRDAFSFIIPTGMVSLSARSSMKFVVWYINMEWEDITDADDQQSAATYQTLMDKFIETVEDLNPHNPALTPDSTHKYFKLSLRMRCLTADLSDFEKGCMKRSIHAVYPNGASTIPGDAAFVVFAPYCM
jgi:hypothetical protein